MPVCRLAAWERSNSGRDTTSISAARLGRVGCGDGYPVICVKTNPRHWHIDHLREHASPIGVWYSYEAEHLEHSWAQTLYDANRFSPIRGFGCSDCKCFSHLFHTINKSQILIPLRMPSAAGSRHGNPSQRENGHNDNNHSEARSIAFWGDSLTEGFPGASYFEILKQQLPEDKLINYGKGGDTVIAFTAGSSVRISTNLLILCSCG